jgi:hypothetical protein
MTFLKKLGTCLSSLRVLPRMISMAWRLYKVQRALRRKAEDLSSLYALSATQNNGHGLERPTTDPWGGKWSKTLKK